MARFKSQSRPTNPFTRSDIGYGRGKGSKGLGKSKTPRRHRKILRDNIERVTKGDIRRLARRGGAKRISTTVYPEMRLALRKHLEKIIQDVCAVVETTGRKTVATSDVVFCLHRMGRTIYGFGTGETSSLRQGS